MPLIFDHAQSPPPGHYYPDPSGWTIRSPSLRQLLMDIREYRRVNGMMAGNPYTDVENFYKVEFPWLVTPVGTSPLAQIDPLYRWMNRTWMKKHRPMMETEPIAARLATCLACPHYDPTIQFDEDTMRRMIILGAGKLRIAGICRAHHWPCGLAVLMSDPEPISSDISGCWANCSHSSETGTSPASC